MLPMLLLITAVLYQCSYFALPAGVADLPAALAEQLQQAGIEAVPHTLKLGYEHFSGLQALKACPSLGQNELNCLAF